MEALALLRILPVAILHRAEDAEPLAEALLQAGMPLLEVTLRTPVAAEAVRRLRAHFPEMTVGMGTLMHPEHVTLALEAGAQFALSAGLQPEVVRAAQRAGLPFIPGVMTPTEVEAAMALGCRLLKLFPAQLAGGLPLLDALAGPYGHTELELIPLGGITQTNLPDYLRHPLVRAVGGSWICESGLIRERRWKEITERAQRALASVAEAPNPERRAVGRCS